MPMVSYVVIMYTRTYCFYWEGLTTENMVGSYNIGFRIIYTCTDYKYKYQYELWLCIRGLVKKNILTFYAVNLNGSRSKTPTCFSELFNLGQRPQRV